MPRDDAQLPRSRHRGFRWLWASSWPSVPALRRALDGVLEVRSAYVNIDEGFFLLHARVEYPVSPAIHDALRDGITLTFDLDTRIERDRRFWFNAGVVDLALRRELTYHAVSDRYVVHDTKTATRQTFADPGRCARLPGQVDAWPIIVEPQLDRRQLHHQRACRGAPRQPAAVHAGAPVLDRRLGARE